MIQPDRARSIFLDHFNPLLRDSRPFGDVRLPGHEASHLMHVTDLVWIKHILGDLDLAEAERDSWAARINRDQDPETGMFRYPPGEPHIDAHATWQAVGALNMVGRKPGYPLACVRPLLAVDRFRSWCDEYDPSASHHRFMLAVIAAGSEPVSDDWRAVFAGWYDARQDRSTGFPCKADTSHSLSPAFLLTIMRLAFCGTVRRADQIVETVLAFQNGWGGFTDSDLPGYLEMDASFLLHRLAPGTPFAARAEAALDRVSEFIAAVLNDGQRRDRLLADPHGSLAVCGNLSILWRYCGLAEAPFPWAELEHFRAAVSRRL
jgi:hypothetical protein